jgi:branched-chain amino acid transport system ATP-binding protein
MSILQVKNIDVVYGDLQVIWDLSFEVGQGEIVALVGANGAGKSTTLRTISGLAPLKKGEIYFNGEAIHKIPPYNLVERGLVHVPEARRLFPEMTVEENLDTGALKGEAKARRKANKDHIFELFPRLLERRRQHAGTLSGGEQQMLAIGRGLMSMPKLMMLDEPSLGLAPLLVKEVFRVINQVRSEGMTILIVEQNVKQTLAIADRAYVLENGKIVMEGKASELADNEHVKAAYLGV